MVKVAEPPAEMEAGKFVVVTPGGRALSERLMLELNPPEIVLLTVALLLFPRLMFNELGETESVNEGFAVPVTVSDTVVVWVVVPSVPETVMG